MSEWRILQNYGKALLDYPWQGFLTLLTIAGIGAVTAFKEAGLYLLLIIGVVVFNHYLIFRKQIIEIDTLKRTIVNTAPDVVPRFLKMSFAPQTHGKFILPIRNEGKNSARNIYINMTYKDQIYSAEHDSLAQDDGVVCLNNLRESLVGPHNSRERIEKMESNDETMRLECRFSDPSGVEYTTSWECELIILDSSKAKTSDPVISTPWKKISTV